MASKGDTEQAADGWTGSRPADQVGRKESSESHRWTCNAERPLTKAQRAYSDLAVECQVTIPADFRAAAASDRDQSSTVVRYAAIADTKAPTAADSDSLQVKS